MQAVPGLSNMNGMDGSDLAGRQLQDLIGLKKEREI